MGTDERKHGHLIETVRCLLFQSKVLKYYWVEARLMTVCAINRLPLSSIDNISPYEKLCHRSPDYKFLRTFRALCFPLLPRYQRDKFSPKSVECFF